MRQSCHVNHDHVSHISDIPTNNEPHIGNDKGKNFLLLKMPLYFGLEQ